MTSEQFKPNLDELLAAIGEAGQRMSNMQASEGAAGNISVYIGWPVDVTGVFPLTEAIELPQPASLLANKLVIITGSGCRLRDIKTDPEANLGVVAIGPDGRVGQLHTSPRRQFDRVTSEFNTHLDVHEYLVGRTATDFHALIHAQPPHLVYLSHIPAYRDQQYFNRQLHRWEPEAIVEFPDPYGVGVLPFLVPSSNALRDATVECMEDHRLVVWSKHGVVARSLHSVADAADLIEYAEAAARYEYMDLAGGGKADGLTEEELRAIAEAHLPTDLPGG